MGIFSGLSSAFDNWQENRTERVRIRQEGKAVSALTGQQTGLSAIFSGLSGVTDSILGNPKKTIQTQGSNTGVLIAGAVGLVVLITVLYFTLRRK